MRLEEIASELNEMAIEIKRTAGDKADEGNLVYRLLWSVRDDLRQAKQILEENDL